MSNHQWAFGDLDNGDHFVQASSDTAQLNIQLDAEDLIVLSHMIEDAIEEEGYEEDEVFA